MPTPEQILEGLRQIANDWRFLAILWHGYFGILALALGLKFRPGRRTMGLLLALPLLSVSILALTARNPFNGVLFGLSAIGLVWISRGLTSRPVRIGARWLAVTGSGLFLFGWIYPHFLDTTSVVPYIYAAPTGLIPCPTLSIVIGTALIFGGLESRSWSVLAGLAGLFYGLFGAIRLGVTIDWILVAGSLTILAGLTSKRQRMHNASNLN